MVPGTFGLPSMKLGIATSLVMPARSLTAFTFILEANRIGLIELVEIFPTSRV
ncbi:hypothetical protein D3C83_46170 [compost metagenome]